MSKATASVEGFLARTAEIGRSNSGDPYLNLSIPHTPRKKNRDTGQWEDAGETLWVTFTLWRDEAEAFAPHAVKGSLVRVEGEPTIRTYDRNGQTGINLDLRFARASLIPRQTSQDRPGSTQTPSGGDWTPAPTGGAQNASWPPATDTSPF